MGSVLLPWQRARAWWESHRSDGLPFSALLANYVERGHYVWASPTEFVVAAEVEWTPGGAVRTGPNPNAWFLHLAATAPGTRFDPWVFMRLAPRPHPWIIFDRRGKGHAYRWEQFAGRQIPLPMSHG